MNLRKTDDQFFVTGQITPERGNFSGVSVATIC